MYDGTCSLIFILRCSCCSQYMLLFILELTASVDLTLGLPTQMQLHMRRPAISLKQTAHWPKP